jgi:hypothetical protein
MKSLIGSMSYHHTFFYKQNGPKKSEPASLDDMIRNNADNKPSFFFYVTDEIYVRLMLSGMVGKTNRPSTAAFNSDPTPSSNFILEIVTDNDGI